MPLLSILKVSIRQIKAARSLLGWSQEALAEASGVSVPTIKRLEAADGELGGRAETGEKIVATLQAANVEFLNHGQPGVRIRAASDDASPKPVGPATDAVDAMDEAIKVDRGKRKR